MLNEVGALFGAGYVVVSHKILVLERVVFECNTIRKEFPNGKVATLEKIIIIV